MAVMERICRITIPGLSVKRHFEAARRRLLADFPAVHEVLATTAPSTLLVLYAPPGEADAWVDALLDSIPTCGGRETGRLHGWRDGRRRGDDSAA
jgi:hypothetical protein